jgi:NAD dependent epimerase/dehydratase family enzyme
MSSSIKMGLGAPLGNGDQYMPWIHIDDIANLYIYALTSEMNGVYNAVSSQHATNKELTKEIAIQLNKKIRLKRVPSFLIKTIYGEMADILIKGPRVNNEGLLKSGFKFEYPELKSALKNIFN